MRHPSLTSPEEHLLQVGMEVAGCRPDLRRGVPRGVGSVEAGTSRLGQVCILAEWGGGVGTAHPGEVVPHHLLQQRPRPAASPVRPPTRLHLPSLATPRQGTPYRGPHKIPWSAVRPFFRLQNVSKTGGDSRRQAGLARTPPWTRSARIHARLSERRVPSRVWGTPRPRVQILSLADTSWRLEAVRPWISKDRPMSFAAGGSP